MFWLFISDLALRTAQEDLHYKGFNKETIELLNMIEPLAGFFAAIRD